ncbi:MULTISPECIES: hypothetical protein [Frankia]|uniref:Uncharacterized protein n=1 Tax=Frankia alni (strain DSM 45986 / CECT 9034 / ACN14a) TaxID=326424 RepID=Q0RRH6_FRAAA|nr:MULTISPECIES: hypothetical protein [Frankia]CAJ59843.1 hypothetical protein FRAAL1181 [Frankia alni ACN14a]
MDLSLGAAIGGDLPTCREIAQEYSGPGPVILVNGVDRTGADLGLLRKYQVCPVGFDPGTRLAVAVTAASGEVVRSTEICMVCDSPADAELLDALYWTPFLGTPAGRYTVTATDGRQVWRTAFTLLPGATSPLMVIRDYDNDLHPGDEAVVELAGFRPGDQVAIDFFFAGESQAKGEYRTSVVLRADDQGNARYRLVTDEDDPRGGWNLLARPAGGFPSKPPLADIMVPFHLG